MDLSPASQSDNSSMPYSSTILPFTRHDHVADYVAGQGGLPLALTFDDVLLMPTECDLAPSEASAAAG